MNDGHEISDVRFGFIGNGVPAPQIVKLGILAEKYGFDSIWLPDHLADIDGAHVDPWTVLASIGAKTKKVFLSPAVTDTQRCHPAKIAQIVATLDELTGGRAGLGLGAGEAMNTVPFGLEWYDVKTRLERLKEAIEVIKLLWSSSKHRPQKYEGKHFRLRNAYIDQHAIQKPHPPIYLGAIRSRTLLRMTGELCDGWFPFLNTPDSFRERLHQVKIGAKRADRDPEEIDAIAWLFVAFTKESDVTEKIMRYAKAIMFTERSCLETLGYQVPLKYEYTHILANIPFETIEDLANHEDVKAIPDEIVNKVMKIGCSSEECIETIDRFARAGADCIALYDLQGIDTKYTLKIISKEIMPYFKDR